MPTEANELAIHKIVTRDGVVNAVVLDRVSPDRIYLMLLRGAVSAQYARTTDNTPTVPRSVKDLVVFPTSEL